VGVVYGVVRPTLGGLAVGPAGLALAAGAMLAGDVPPTLTGTTNPTLWGVTGWLSDIVPHLVYGFTTAAAYETLMAGAARDRGARW
jgi:hypothetical protein